MSRWSRIVWLSLAGLATSAPAADEPALVLEPTSDWVLDYAEERCSFYRTFGNGQDALILRIDSFGSATEYRILVTGPAVPDVDVPTSDLVVRLTPDTEDRLVQGLNGKVGESPGVSFSISFGPYEDLEITGRMSRTKLKERSAQPRYPEPEFEAMIRDLRIKFNNSREIGLALGPMGRPLAAMRECLQNLQTSWGLDPSVQNSLTRLAVPKLSTVRRVQRDYPSNMVRSGTNAYVPVRVMVDAEGQTTACVVQIAEIDTAFKEAVCRNLARGYEPALDAEGRPVASMFRTFVFYLLN